MSLLNTLQTRFGQVPGLSFIQQDALVLAIIDSPLAVARVAVQGAQLIDWKPKSEEKAVVWSAEAPTYESGKSVRGGIPICWPWFGNHPTLNMAHGFVRTMDWQLLGAHAQTDGILSLHWRLTDSPATQAIWPHAFELDVLMHIGQELRVQLVTHNTGSDTLGITQGLHTYLHIGDSRSVIIRGLEGGFYLDKLNGFARTPQDDVITLSGAVDRIYFGTTRTVEVEDSEFNRVLVIAKEGSHSTVVWNPDEQVPSGMRPEESRVMVCVEAVNAADDTISVAPGERKILGTTISVRGMS